MEFVFDSDIKRQAPPEAPDFTAFDEDFNPGGKQQQSSLLASRTAVRKTARRTGHKRKKLPDSFSDIEFNEPPKRTKKRAAGAKVNYVKSVKKKRRKSASKPFQWTWTKAGWIFCFLLVLRLIFMESGVIDYHSMHKTLESKQNNLKLLRLENAELIQEINKIKTSPSYQKKLARDHLGVIAKDEYLVLFSRESELSSSI